MTSLLSDRNICVSGSVLVSLLGLYCLFTTHYTDTSRHSGPSTWFLEGLLWCACFCSCRYLAINFVFNHVASMLVSAGHLKAGNESKFVTSAFKATFFFFMCAYEYSVISVQPFAPPELGGRGSTTEMWHAPPFAAPASLCRLYMVSIGYHLQSTIYHCCFVERRADFYQMVFHHVVTLWLIVLSFYIGGTRTGVLIIFVNDVPDFFMYVCKCLGDSRHALLLVLPSYALMLLSYLYFRIIVMPYTILYSILWEMSEAYIPIRPAFLVFLFSLYALHGFWFFLMLKIGASFFKTGSREDITATKMK